MAKKKLRIGLVGYGFMGRAHSNAFLQAPRYFDFDYEPELVAVCGRDKANAEAHAARWGYSSVETDWHALIDRDDIDMIDIAAPNDMHKDIAIAAAEAGKMIMCEKPLGRNADESREMVAAVEKAGVPNMVWYNYRRIPAVTLAKQIIDGLGGSIVINSDQGRGTTVRLELPRRPPSATSALSPAHG